VTAADLLRQGVYLELGIIRIAEGDQPAGRAFLDWGMVDTHVFETLLPLFEGGAIFNRECEVIQAGPCFVESVSAPRAVLREDQTERGARD